MTTINAIVYLILMQAWSQVSGQESNCPEDCTLASGQDSNCPQNCTAVNIAREAISNLTSVDNHAYTTTGQASWVTDGVTSGQCASVSSIYPAWEAEFGQNRTVTRIKIFWEDQQDDVYVSVDGRICHTPKSSYIWKNNYTLECDVPVTGDHLLIYRQPTTVMLNLTFCEVEIYANHVVTSSSMSMTTTSQTMSTFTTTSMPTTSKTMSTSTMTTSLLASSTMSTAFWVTMSTTAQTSNTMTTPPTATAHPSETSTPPSGAAESPDSRFPLLYVIVTGAVVAGVVTVAVVAVVCVRRQKGKRSQAKDAKEAVMPSYEMCVAEPSDHIQYQIIQSHRTPRGWSNQTSTYVNTTPSTSYENINENEYTYVNNEYVNDQNVSTGTSCYVNVGSNNQDIGEAAGESNMYVNTTDFSLYENTLNIRT